MVSWAVVELRSLSRRDAIMSNTMLRFSFICFFSYKLIGFRLAGLQVLCGCLQCCCRLRWQFTERVFIDVVPSEQVFQSCQLRTTLQFLQFSSFNRQFN